MCPDIVNPCSIEVELIRFAGRMGKVEPPFYAETSPDGSS
jgi:hypothetical protein